MVWFPVSSLRPPLPVGPTRPCRPLVGRMGDWRGGGTGAAPLRRALLRPWSQGSLPPRVLSCLAGSAPAGGALASCMSPSRGSGHTWEGGGEWEGPEQVLAHSASLVSRCYSHSPAALGMTPSYLHFLHHGIGLRPPFMARSGPKTQKGGQTCKRRDHGVLCVGFA